MNIITVESANAMIFHFLQEITKEKELEPKLDPKKDDFDPNKLKQEKVILMPRLKETGLDIYDDFEK